MFSKTVPMGDLSISATAASSPLVYESFPNASAGTSDRTFCLLMPNSPRHVHVQGRSFVQQPGECVLADSAMGVVAAYEHPHAAVCLTIPAATLRNYVAEPGRFDGMRFGGHGSLARIVSTLLLSIWEAAEAGAAGRDGRRASDAVLGLLGRACARSPFGAGRADASRRLSCDLLKAHINADIRNPQLSVQLIAQRFGVTTRYLQLLFAREDNSVSEYIKRERLRGCLLDLRDARFAHQSITEIAFAWGFNSATHFSSSFRKEYGLSPRDYRSCDLEQFAALRLSEVEGPLIQALLLSDRAEQPRKDRTRMPRPWRSNTARFESEGARLADTA
jgi:AraC-like DNA-binding protein